MTQHNKNDPAIDAQMMYIVEVERGAPESLGFSTWMKTTVTPCVCGIVLPDRIRWRLKFPGFISELINVCSLEVTPEISTSTAVDADSKRLLEVPVDDMDNILTRDTSIFRMTETNPNKSFLYCSVKPCTGTSKLIDIFADGKRDPVTGVEYWIAAVDATGEFSVVVSDAVV
jgi:hypothetical protein